MDQPQFIPWTEPELAQLRELAGKYPSTEISKMIVGRSAMGIQKMMRKQGLPRYIQYPPSRPIPEPKKRVRTKKAVKDPVEHHQPVAPLVEPLKPKTIREARVSHVSYPPLEWCPTCHSPVSNWGDHTVRLGCKRPAA